LLSWKGSVVRVCEYRDTEFVESVRVAKYSPRPLVQVFFVRSTVAGTTRYIWPGKAWALARVGLSVTAA